MRDYQERVKFVKRRFRPPEKIERGLKNELDPLYTNQTDDRRFLIQTGRLVQNSDAMLKPLREKASPHCRSVSPKLTLFVVYA